MSISWGKSRRALVLVIAGTVGAVALPGTYLGVAAADVVFPQGTTPPRLKLNDFNQQRIDC
jgi:hypothetical protein